MEQETYFIQRTEEGPFIFLIQARKNQTFDPVVEYDAKKNIFLIRTPLESILLDSLPSMVRQELEFAPYVEIAEIDVENKEIYRLYEAPIKVVEEVSETKI